jgi:hypothetical protein
MDFCHSDLRLCADAAERNMKAAREQNAGAAGALSMSNDL